MTPVEIPLAKRLHLIREQPPEGVRWFRVWCEDCEAPLYLIHLEQPPIDPLDRIVDDVKLGSTGKGTGEIELMATVVKPRAARRSRNRKLRPRSERPKAELRCDRPGCGRTFGSPRALHQHQAKSHREASRPLDQPPTRRPWTRITEAERSKVIELWRAGNGPSRIHFETGIPVSHIRKLLQEMRANQ